MTTTPPPIKHVLKDAVLVTGGAGFIGSHTLLCLLDAGYRCVVVDNFDNSSPESISRVRELSKCDQLDIQVVEIDLLDLQATKRLLRDVGPFVGCIHFAGFKAVGESVALPLHYYANNLISTLNLMNVLNEMDCKSIVFSSSATVYGLSEKMPLKETEAAGATNPYGHTKYMIEQILKDVVGVPSSQWRVAVLRYFNPVGAHPSGRIGEDPQGIPNNLLPFVAQVAVGLREKVQVFGSDYATPDGTGVRDYIHVMDLARAHVFALKKVSIEGALPRGTLETYNVGTGKGNSVLDVVKSFEKACGKPIPYVLAPRRPGDVAQSVCDPTKAKVELGFQTELTLDDACRDAWKWQTQNPNGYGTSGGDKTRKAMIFSMFGSGSR